MIEVIAMMILPKKFSAMATAKGRSGKLFHALTIFLWFFCEISATVIAVRLLGARTTLGIVIPAILGGAIGGLITFLIVKFMPEASSAKPAMVSADGNPAPLWTEPTTVECTACGATVKLPARFCDTCGAKIENNLG